LPLIGPVALGSLLAGRLIAFRVVPLAVGSVALARLFGLAGPFVGGGVLAFAAGSATIGFLSPSLFAASRLVAPLRAIGIGFPLPMGRGLRLILAVWILLLVGRLLAVARSDLLRFGRVGFVHTFLPRSGIPLRLLVRAAA